MPRLPHLLAVFGSSEKNLLCKEFEAVFLLVGDLDQLYMFIRFVQLGPNRMARIRGAG